MGMSFNPMYQPTSTTTITVDGDLDVSPYDVLGTDGKFDTVEATEFVGGVGNFSSGLISGGLDVRGILHAESTMQVDEDLILDGSINNVNITAEGAITTAKSITATGGFKGNVTGSISGGSVAGSTGTFSGAVTGVSFNGVVLKSSGTITVTPTSNYIYIPNYADHTPNLTILPLCGNVVYSGRITLKNTTSNKVYFDYWNGSADGRQTITLTANSTANYNFTSIPFLTASGSSGVQFTRFTLT